MPPKSKKYQEPEPESEEEQEDDYDEGRFDQAKFTNPNYSREFLAKLPQQVRDRVTALQGMDAEYLERKSKHDFAVIELQRKYEELAQPTLQKRKGIVTGTAEPSEEDIARGIPEDHQKEGISVAAGETGEVGIPGFWLRALQHHCIIAEMITERDEAALKHLTNILVVTLPPPELGFTLVFEFSENEFFAESSISKTFRLKQELDIVLDRTESTPITWKTGKNLTVKTITKKQVSKKGGQSRYVTSEVPTESFFLFFKSQDEAEDDDDENDDDYDEEDQWHAMAQTIKEKIIPFAVEYYTGEAPDGESDMDDGEEEDEEEEEEEEEEELPPQRIAGKKGVVGGKQSAPQPAGKKCPQQ